ncbi:MAG: [protein-PII] uridylyltransferase [Limisphaerales bacterium]
MPTLLEKIEASAAERLVLPANRMPSQELARYKTFLKVETHRVKMLHHAGASGLEVCHARSAILDLLLRHIVEGVLANSPELAQKPLNFTGSPADQAKQRARSPVPIFTLVATGGYGRAELNPCSDIDIMFLHESELALHPKANPALSALVDGLLYTLWDLGFKVGHSVRTVEDCVKVASKDIQSKTSLLETRRIMGDEKLFDRFHRTLLAKCVLGQESEYINARVQDQAARRAKFGNSPFMQEPNIKNGCGGLRDYQNLIWMTYFKYRTSSLEELQQKEMISESERKQLEAAYDFLLRARTELHYHADRAADALNKAAQAPVAYELGYKERSPSKRVEEFMRDYYTHARNIDLITRTVEQRLALLPKTGFIPSFGAIFRSQAERMRRHVVDGFKCVDGEIHFLSRNIFRDNPRRIMRVFLHAQQRGLKLNADLAQLIRSQLSLVNNEFLRDPHVRETFLEILDQRGNVAPVLRAMHEVGVLGKFIPEFGKLTCLVQHEFYHQYTADEHTLVCIEKLDQVWNAKTPPFSSYAELFPQVEHPHVLYLALLLHDAGKALDTGKHEEASAKLAEKAAARLGLDGAKTHTLRLLIENHLTMVQISQRRDLDDPTVIRNFARQIQTVENLVMLTLHTFADSMGTSDQLWNGFKDAAMWQLYRKTRDALSGAPEFLIAEARQRDLLSEEVERLAPDTFDTDEIAAHFNNLPTRYFQINDAKEILRDITHVHRFLHVQMADDESNALAPVIAWHNEPDRGYSTVTVTSWDREGLFSKITGCLTAAGLNIFHAEILTRNDGIILDSFSVNDARTGLLPNKDGRDRFESIMHKVLVGTHVDLPGIIAKMKVGPQTYKSLEGERIPTSVTFDNELSETRTIIDIEAEDRIGLLYDISRALNDLNLDVSIAKILTEKGAASDTFYVTEWDKTKITHPDRLRHIEHRLRSAIGR